MSQLGQWVRRMFGPAALTTVEAADTATLTLLGDGFVLGVPRRSTDSDRAEAVDAIKAWLSHGHGGVILPWPCDVDDQRS